MGTLHFTNGAVAITSGVVKKIKRGIKLTGIVL